MARCQKLVERISIALAAALLPPAARAGDRADIVEPRPYLVRVHLEGDRPDFKLTLSLARIGTGDVPLCTEPCDRALSIKRYQRFVLTPELASGAVQIAYQEIPPFALPPGLESVRISVRSGEPERRIAGAFVLGGGSVLTGLGLAIGVVSEAVIAAAPDRPDHATARTVRDAGFVAAGVGLATALGGLLLIALSPPPRATLEPGD